MNENQISNESKDKLAMANHCYFALQPTFRSKNLSKTSKIIIYKTILITSSCIMCILISWAGHVQLMPEDRAMQVFLGMPGGED